jgi:ABC-2 type transport system ATP-binding protein
VFDAPAVIPDLRRKIHAMSLLEVSHLRKTYGSTVAVDDLSFGVDAGEVFGLLGPNGAGKSTTMMVLAGLRHADSGTVTIAGYSAGTGRHELQMMLGVVPQDLAIYPDLTAAENLRFFGKIYRLRGADLERRVGQVIELIGLEPYANQYVRSYSGGMKRRLNFGVALLHDPKFVILDEPTVGIDPQSRTHLLECVQQLASRGVGVIYASHYMEEVEAICRRVAIIDHGRLLVCGTLDELLDKAHSDVYLRVAASAEVLKRTMAEEADVVPIGGDESYVVVKRELHAAPGVITSRLASVLAALSTAGLEVVSTETREHDLERLFLELTGRTLRDA